MRLTAVLLLGAAAVVAQQPITLTQKEVDDGWILLFDGETMFGWTPVGEPKWAVEDGAIVALPGHKTLGWIRSGSQFADYHLKMEFRAAEDANSGVFLRSATEGQPHVTGYELQIWRGNEKFPTGSLVNHASTFKGSIKGGVWNQYDVTVQGDRFIVVLNGKKVLDARDSKSKVGHIGMQSNQHKIEFRNIKVKPLGLTPLFDGKKLAGWHEVKPSRAPKEPPEWSVKSGAIHVEKGPGQLETDGTYDDFILQLAIRTNPQNEKHHPNSGVFLRGEPNGYWTGYESQIRNEYKDGDRTRPVDFGSGGIYHYQPARKVMGDDGKYFVKTVVMRGRHIGIWVNGYPVSDWEDPHPEGKVVSRKEARLGAGAISLQAHDPTTNLDFRNIRLVKLPR